MIPRKEGSLAQIRKNQTGIYKTREGNLQHKHTQCQTTSRLIQFVILDISEALSSNLQVHTKSLRGPFSCPTKNAIITIF